MSHTPLRVYHEFDGVRFVLIRDSLNITFYMRSSHRDIQHAVARALDAYCRAAGPRKPTCYVDYDGEWQDLDESGWAFIREAISSPNGAMITLAEKPEIGASGFEYHGRNLDSPLCADDPGVVSVVSFWLPTEFMEEHGPSRVRELALELGAELPFNSGFAGLCFQYPEEVVGPEWALRKVCFDYPGLEIPDLSRASTDLGTRVRTVQWLTFLGQPVLGELGGPVALRSRLTSPGTTVQELERGRAVVTLGRHPEAGDKEPERTLAPYRELARLLEPWLFLNRPPWRGFTEEDMRRWERRFL